MTWLSELVESSEDSLEALPVPCLCEFLLANQMQEGELEGGVEEVGPSGERLGHRETYRKKKAGRTKVGGAGGGSKEDGLLTGVHVVFCVPSHLHHACMCSTPSPAADGKVGPSGGAAQGAGGGRRHKPHSCVGGAAVLLGEALQPIP